MAIVNQYVPMNTKRFTKLCFVLALSSLVYACGGGAGDDDNIPQSNDAAIAAVSPVVGVWNLPTDWDGVGSGKAYLLIKTPDNNGEAAAILYDQDDAGENCFYQDGFAGNVTQSLVGDLFLEVSAIPSAIVALLPNGDLQISEFSEAAGTSAPAERVLVATQLGITESGIPLCS